MILAILLSIAALVISFPALIIAFAMYKSYNARRKILNSKGEMISGPSIFQLLKDQVFVKKNVALAEPEYKKQFGDVYLTSFGPSQNVIIHKPEHVKKALLEWRAFPKEAFPTTGRLLKRFAIDSVIFANGENWQRHRKMMDPTFMNLGEFVQPFIAETKLCLNVFEKNHFTAGAKESTLIPIHDYMQRFTLEVLGKTVFGVDFNYLEGEPSKYLKAYNHIMHNMNPLLFIFPFLSNLPLPSVTKMLENYDTLDELIYNLIRGAAAKLETKQAKAEGESKTMLEMMVEANIHHKNSLKQQQEAEDGAQMQALSDKELRDNVYVFFLAGHETSANSLSFVLYNLAKNPAVQNKLYEEITQVIGKDSLPTYESIKQCEYMDMIIKETLRMYPPATGVVGRECTKTQKFGDFTLPEHSVLRVSIYLLHHDVETWGDPEVFRPERFLPEETKKRSAFSFMPFGFGPRTCIGNNFSLLEQKIFLAMLMQKYRVELPNPNFTIQIAPLPGILQPSSDFRVKFVKRE